MSEVPKPISRHEVIVTKDRYANMQKAAENVGGITLALIADSGQAYTTKPTSVHPGSLKKETFTGVVPEDGVYIEIASQGDTGDFYREADRLSVENASQTQPPQAGEPQ